MEIELKEQCNTLGSMLREHLEKECEEEFATCVVPEVSSDFLLVSVPNISVLRKSLIGCKQELEKLEVYLNRGKRKKN